MHVCVWVGVSSEERGHMAWLTSDFCGELMFQALIIRVQGEQTNSLWCKSGRMSEHCGFSHVSAYHFI